MRAIGIIPARMGSTRFPGKPLAMIARKPMVRWVWDAAKAAQLIYSVHVATDSPEIADYCEKNGLAYIMTSRECRNGTERVFDALRQIAMRDPDDVVINIQGDEPLIRPESLDALARAFMPGVKVASLYFRPSSPAFGSDPNRVKVLVGSSGRAYSFSRIMGTGYLWRSYGQHIGVYAYRRDVLPKLIALEPDGTLEQSAWIRAGYDVQMVEVPYETIAVDAPEDIGKVERAMCPSV